MIHITLHRTRTTVNTGGSFQKRHVHAPLVASVVILSYILPKLTSKGIKKHNRIYQGKSCLLFNKNKCLKEVMFSLRSSLSSSWFETLPLDSEMGSSLSSGKKTDSSLSNEVNILSVF